MLAEIGLVCDKCSAFVPLGGRECLLCGATLRRRDVTRQDLRPIAAHENRGVGMVAGSAAAPPTAPVQGVLSMIASSTQSEAPRPRLETQPQNPDSVPAVDIAIEQTFTYQANSEQEKLLRRARKAA